MVPALFRCTPSDHSDMNALVKTWPIIDAVAQLAKQILYSKGHSRRDKVRRGEVVPSCRRWQTRCRNVGAKRDTRRGQPRLKQKNRIG